LELTNVINNKKEMMGEKKGELSPFNVVVVFNENIFLLTNGMR
jgi:hypothetical protein